MGSWVALWRQPRGEPPFPSVAARFPGDFRRVLTRDHFVPRVIPISALHGLARAMHGAAGSLSTKVGRDETTSLQNCIPQGEDFPAAF